MQIKSCGKIILTESLETKFNFLEKHEGFLNFISGLCTNVEK